MHSKNNNFVDQIIKNVFYQGVSGVITKFGALIFTIAAARFLLPDSFGIYSLTLTIILTIITLSDLGIGTAITRYVSDSLSKKGKEKARVEARSRFLFLFKFKFFFSLLLAALLFLLAQSISVLFKKPDLVLPLQIGSIYLFLTSIYGMFLPLFLGIQRVKYGTIASAIFEGSRIIFLFLFLYLYKSVWAVFLGLSLASFLAAIFCFWIIYKKYNFLIRGEVEEVESRRLLFFSSFIAINSINVIVFTNIDKLMLGYFVNSTFVGFYTAIFTVVSGVLGLISFSGAVFPALVNLKGTKLKNIFQKTFNYMFLIAFPISLVLSILFIPILKILYGVAYVPQQHSFAILITAILLSFLVLEFVCSSIYTMFFNAKEKPKWPALIALVSAIINVVLNFVFISIFMGIRSDYALIGAALATFISRYLNLIFLSIMARKKFGLTPKISFLWKPFVSSVIIFLVLLAFFSFVEPTIITVILSMIISAIVYLFVMLKVGGIKKEDFRKRS